MLYHPQQATVSQLCMNVYTEHVPSACTQVSGQCVGSYVCSLISSCLLKSCPNNYTLPGCSQHSGQNKWSTNIYNQSKIHESVQPINAVRQTWLREMCRGPVHFLLPQKIQHGQADVLTYRRNVLVCIYDLRLQKLLLTALDNVHSEAHAQGNIIKDIMYISCAFQEQK